MDANLTAVANVANLANVTAAGLDSHRGSDAATRGPVVMTVVTDVPKSVPMLASSNGAMAVASIHVALAVDRSHGASSAEATIPRWHAQSVLLARRMVASWGTTAISRTS